VPVSRSMHLPFQAGLSNRRSRQKRLHPADTNRATPAVTLSVAVCPFVVRWLTPVAMLLNSHPERNLDDHRTDPGEIPGPADKG
jgi:hypothetical protein